MNELPILERMKRARMRLYMATRHIDEIWRGRGGMTEPEALEAALKPFLDAAATLPVRQTDAKSG